MFGLLLSSCLYLERPGCVCHASVLLSVLGRANVFPVYCSPRMDPGCVWLTAALAYRRPVSLNEKTQLCLLYCCLVFLNERDLGLFGLLLPRCLH